MIGGWTISTEQLLREKLGATSAARLIVLYGDAFSQSYLSRFDAAETANDIERLATLASSEDREVRFYRSAKETEHQIRLKIYRTASIMALSDIVPVLENFGFKVVDVYPYEVGGEKPGWIHDFLLSSPTVGDISSADMEAIENAIRQVLSGESENDSFNALIAGAGLNAFAVSLFRALFRYLRQAGNSFGQTTIAHALLDNAAVAQALINLFSAKHDPSQPAEGRPAAIETARGQVEAALASVQAIDQDAILRAFLSLVEATVRTNAFVPGGPEALAFKLNCSAIPDLPKPAPWREIFVSSPRVEGVHLRGGPVSRGGVRWSDRRDDYRTEVLGLIKAQIVKNAVIVPTGAKGGFFAKQLPPASDRDAWLAEGQEAYRIFIRALLSLTDNLVAGEIVHPEHVVTDDGADPYLVVAADKGTAAFSDTANAIAEAHNFWLGDAFASGGSNGYDHKAMAITARGAWISVQRHFSELGIDVQTESVNVAGVGDMSGDVFGNGMLRSSAIRLVAAFDHRHIFIDPNPDTQSSWNERKRLFDLPRSSWADYDEKLISKGGGVWPRTQKEITLSAEMQALLATDATSLSPNALIQAILKAPIDLIWFGGIGTYIKSQHETHAMVSDRANDAIRVNGSEVRSRVIGEGANLGVTQAGRIEYAASGGRINADFIDNSGGVDCSDNEVNIKIALNGEVREKRLSEEDRNALLHDMTDAVADLVLDDNRQQTLALSLAEKTAAQAIGEHQRIIQRLEASGRLDRAVEGLPDDEQFALRRRDGRGLERPELAIVMAYAKMAMQDALTTSKPAIGPLHMETLLNAFPAQMVSRFSDSIKTHHLRDDIVATKTGNRLINHLGFARPYIIVDEEGVDIADVGNAYVAIEALFDLPSLWPAIEAASKDGRVVLALMDRAASAIAFHLTDIARLYPAETGPDAIVERLAAANNSLAAQIDDWAKGTVADEINRLQADEFMSQAPADLLDRLARLQALDGVIGIADLAVTLKLTGKEVLLARAYNTLGNRLGLDWAKAQALALPVSGQWEKLLINGIARDLEQSRLDLLARIYNEGQSPVEAVDNWLGTTTLQLTRFDALIANVRKQPEITAAMLAQIARQARVLLDERAHPAQ